MAPQGAGCRNFPDRRTSRLALLVCTALLVAAPICYAVVLQDTTFAMSFRYRGPEAQAHAFEKLQQSINIRFLALHSTLDRDPCIARIGCLDRIEPLGDSLQEASVKQLTRRPDQPT